VKKFINKLKTDQKMRPWVHFLFSLILAVIFYPTFNYGVIFIFIGGVLINIDNYFWYIYRYKKFNASDCYRWFTIYNVKNNYRDIIGSVLIFHTIEFLLLSVILSFYIEFILMFTIGLLIHFLLNLVLFCSKTLNCKPFNNILDY
jgi:hypothetical protein